MRHLIAAVTVLLTTGCASLGSRQTSNDSQVCMGRASPRALAEGAVLGAVGGAALGAGAGQLVDRKPGVGAAAGSAIGGLLGLLYALQVENKFQQAQCQELALDTAIKVTQRFNEMSQQLNENLANYMNTLSAKILLANRQTKERQTRLQQLNADKAQLYQVQSAIEQGIEANGKVLETLRTWQFPQSARALSLNTELARLEAQNEALRGNAHALAALGLRM